MRRDAAEEVTPTLYENMQQARRKKRHAAATTAQDGYPVGQKQTHFSLSLVIFTNRIRARLARKWGC